MRHDDWHFGLLARESLKNVFGKGSRLLPVVALAILTGAGSSAYIAFETKTMRQEIHSLASSGRNVLVFSAASNDAPSLIDRNSCEALADDYGISHAGILDPAGEIDVLPIGSRLPSQRASLTLFPELAAVDILVGHNLLSEQSKPFTVQAGGEVVTAARSKSHPEDLGVGSSITLPPAAAEKFSRRCVVILDEFSNAELALPVIASQLKVTINPASGSELLKATSDPADAYLQRVDRWLPVLLGLLGAVATSITMRLRASEVAVYRMSGSSSMSLMTMLTMEILCIAGCAAMSATGAAMIMSADYLDVSVPILWGLALAGSWSVLALAASLDLAARRPSELAKDR